MGHRERSRFAGPQPYAAPRAWSLAWRQRNLAPERNHLSAVLANEAERLLVEQPGHHSPVVWAWIEEDLDVDGAL